ncbi:DMT family transporter [Dechloromonas denitrificans]|jgi:drug/metabolite transporter (DMT)-like permease|uniref:DMT family transporter n=1 Tax=Dechloromonas denitrificans TaxID=281362 RepID=UPI001CF8A040|nr:DMT family transporter [Dechloromonas denitrificans]UCV10391.1 DMT family transporter [Dechloromonas denitrificans]
MPIPIAYFTIVAIWSTTPLAIQWSALGTGFAFAVMARMLIGATLALVLIVVWRIGFPLHRKARQSYLVGGLGMFGAMLSTYWGAQYIHSGLVSVLFGLTPLATSVLAVFWLGERALRPAKLIGMALGILGLALIFATGHEVSGHQAVLGIAALLLAVFLYSASLVGVKRIGDHSPPLATTAGTLLVALPLFILAWWLVDGQIPTDIPPRAGAAIVYLGIFGSVLGFALYYYVIKHMDAGKVSLITLITPVIALILGNVLNGEMIEPRVWLGAGLITLGLGLHQWPMLASAFLRR